ncbi:MAG TPA: hypothetical protein VHH73_19410, partial [Verrucomicrobiae bacterium]|nr:hypothetical protein [Verrucomicrobiae bacterium]
VGLLAPAVQNKAPLVKVCSWCKRVATPKWVQAEQAVAKLGLFELEPPPGITHGICDDCHRQALQQMD